MSFEEVKCQQCGSDQVFEFKPGSYVCGLCDTVFKGIPKVDRHSARVCEVDECGVIAIGRCGDCGDAFCVTHRGLDNWGRGYVDLCRMCLSKRNVQKAESKSMEFDERISRIKKTMDVHVHEISRAAVALRACGSSHEIEGDPSTHFDDRILERVCPELAGISTFYGVLPWNTHAIADWFRDEAKKEGVTPNDRTRWFTESRSFTGQVRARYGEPEPAWTFPRESSSNPGHVWVFLDGRVKFDGTGVCKPSTKFRKKPYFVPPDGSPDGNDYRFRLPALYHAAVLLGW